MKLSQRLRLQALINYVLRPVAGSLIIFSVSSIHAEDTAAKARQVRDADERLLFVSDQASAVTGTTASNIGTNYNWLQNEESLVLLRYTSQGLLAEKSNFDLNGTLLESESFVYENGRMVSRILHHVASKKRLISTYNADGKMIAEESLISGISISKQSFTYADNGKIASSLLTGGKQDGLLISYVYDNDNQLLLEEWHQNQQIQKRISYATTADYVIELYDGGKLFAKDFYEEAVRKRQEIYQNGVMVRQRIFE